MQIIKNYVAENKQRFLDELFQLLRFPSVSADPKYKQDVLNTADFVAQKLKEAGLDNSEVLDLIHSIAIFAWANRLMLNLGEPIFPSV